MKSFKQSIIPNSGSRFISVAHSGFGYNVKSIFYIIYIYIIVHYLNQL